MQWFKVVCRAVKVCLNFLFVLSFTQQLPTFSSLWPSDRGSLKACPVTFVWTTDHMSPPFKSRVWTITKDIDTWLVLRTVDLQVHTCGHTRFLLPTQALYVRQQTCLSADTPSGMFSLQCFKTLTLWLGRPRFESGRWAVACNSLPLCLSSNFLLDIDCLLKIKDRNILQEQQKHKTWCVYGTAEHTYLSSNVSGH